MTTPAYYKDNVPYDASGQAIITITGDKPPTPLVTDLGDGNFKFQSQHQACYLKNVTTLGMQWVTDRPDGGIAMCYATPDEEKVAVSLMTGLLAAPVYTPQQAAAATLLLGAAGAMALSSGRWSMQLSLGGVGAAALPGGGVATLPGGGVNILAGEILAALEAAVSRAAGLLTASTVGPMVAAAAVMFVSLPAGEGSDRVPGRNQQAMFAMNARLLTGKNVAIGLRSSSVNLPVRGALVERNGQLTLELLKTGNGVSATVQVLNAVRDAATGLDIITLPAVGGMPPRTILVNPVPVPTGPGNTGNQTPVPVTPLHTGTDVKPVENIVVTPPAGDIGELWDFIYWRPNAAGTGVEPIYVMLSDPLDSGRFTRKQLDKKFKHAIDFGITDTKKNSETLTKFRDAVEAHLADKETVERGTYRREKGSKVYFNPKSMNVVILKVNGDWLSGWKINPEAENGRIYLETGDL